MQGDRTTLEKGHFHRCHAHSLSGTPLKVSPLVMIIRPPVIWSLRLTRPNWRGATFILSCHRQLHPVTTISSPGIASNAKSQPSLGCWEILPFHEGPNTLEQMASEIMANEVQKELVRHHGDPPQIPFPLIHQFL